MNEYKNNQTTSTKCQYQIDDSKPRWWSLENWLFICRINVTNKKILPIITCKPWKPVATKKVLPYTESAIVKLASMYSIVCRAVKIKPSKIVNNNACSVSEWLFSSIEWWAHVTVTPDLNKIIVFSKGIWKGLKGKIEVGGQWPPTSITTLKVLWKKAQKKEKKNKTSEVINKIIPHRNPFITFNVWHPWLNPSRLTSRHHWYLDIKITISPTSISNIVFKWNHFTNPVVIIMAPKDAVNGHGLFSTKW